MGAIAAAVVFAWLGMVLAISFIEAPLKFRAPGITLQLGLGIGRLVFRALNTVEIVLATVVVVAVVTHPPGRLALVAISVAVTMLLVQSLFVRPLLRRRSDAVLAAAVAPPGGMRERSWPTTPTPGWRWSRSPGCLPPVPSYSSGQWPPSTQASACSTSYTHRTPPTGPGVAR